VKEIYKKIKNNWDTDASTKELQLFCVDVVKDKIEEVIEGNKYALIGNKGHGKTAIHNYLEQKYNEESSEKDKEKKNVFVSMRLEKFERLRELNEGVDYWKAIFYNEVLSHSSLDNIGPKTKQMLTDLFPPYQSKNKLFTQIKNVKLFETLEELEKIIRTYSNPKYKEINFYLLIDDSTNPYSGYSPENIEYSLFFTSLVKCIVEEIRHKNINNKTLKLYPVIFIRPEIYEEVIKNDKRSNWFEGSRIDLKWEPREIERLLRTRISCTLDTKFPSFSDAWDALFDSSWSGSFGRIRMYTRRRPRDYIRIIRCIAEKKTDDSKITNADFKRALPDCSKALFDEIIDESYTDRHLLDYIDFLKKTRFMNWRFSKEALEKVLTKNMNVDEVLKKLYRYNIIGTWQENTDRPSAFHYMGININLRSDEFVINKGLESYFEQCHVINYIVR